MTDKNQRKLQLDAELMKVLNELRPFLASSPETWPEGDWKNFEKLLDRAKAIARERESL